MAKSKIKKADQPEQTNQGQAAPAGQTSPAPQEPKEATQTTGEPIGTELTTPNPGDAADTTATESTTPKKASTPKPIKKNNTKADVTAPKEPQVTHMQAPDANPTPSADPVDNKQMSVDEAVAYAMTTPEPMATVRRLAAQRKLVNVTHTYKALEDLGHK